MTTTTNRRRIGDDPNRDETEGVPFDGFQDPTGEYPKRDYYYGSSINKAARGLKVNNLYVGGGDIGVSLNIVPQEPSKSPFNQAHETASGHSIEYDDTPGGERILIKHRKGAGVEMRADGSVIVSAVNNKIEVTGGDQTTIIEGDANMIFKGNLNLEVAGDYNVDVGGNMNVNVAGHSKEMVALNKRTTVSQNVEFTTKGSRMTKTVGPNVELSLDFDKKMVEQDYSIEVEGNVNLFSDKQVMMSGKNEFVAVSKVLNMSATHISVLGVSGSIGGTAMDFTGKVYQGPLGPVPFTSGAAFYGSFFGQSLQSIASMFADQSNRAGQAGSLGAPGFAPIVTPAMTPIPPSAPPPIAPIVLTHLMGGTYAIRNVSIDPGGNLKNKILLKDDYNGLFEKIPTTQEIRSTIRDPANKSLIGAKMVGEGRLNSDYVNTVPPKIGRTSPKEPSNRFGYVPLGNSIGNRGKRFKV